MTLLWPVPAGGQRARWEKGPPAQRDKPSQSTIKRLLIDLGVKRLASPVLVSAGGTTFEPVDTLLVLESLVWASDIVKNVFPQKEVAGPVNDELN